MDPHTEDRIRNIQKALLSKGHDLGRWGADGDLGPTTEQTILDVIALSKSVAPAPVVADTAAEATVTRFTLPALWLPNASMKRIIWHWTAGAYVASELDKEHYHFVIEGDLDVIKCDHSIKDNEVIHGSNYAAHTLNCNTGSIGLSVCSMAGAVESPFNAGKYPFTEGQFLRLVDITAQLCKRYSIPVSRTTTLSHAEVQPTLGIQQRGKWDYSRLPFAPNIVGAVAVGDFIREHVADAMR